MCRRVKPLPCGREFTRERGDCRAMASILIQGSESEEERIPATLEDRVVYAHPAQKDVEKFVVAKDQEGSLPFGYAFHSRKAHVVDDKAKDRPNAEHNPGVYADGGRGDGEDQKVKADQRRDAAKDCQWLCRSVLEVDA